MLEELLRIEQKLLNVGAVNLQMTHRLRNKQQTHIWRVTTNMSTHLSPMLTARGVFWKQAPTSFSHLFVTHCRRIQEMVLASTDLNAGFWNIIFLLRNSQQLLTIETSQGQESSLERHLVVVKNQEVNRLTDLFLAAPVGRVTLGLSALLVGSLQQKEIQTLWPNSPSIWHALFLKRKTELIMVNGIINQFLWRKCFLKTWMTDFNCC